MASFLKQGILSLQFEPGADLDESRLSRQFDLSRTPVREVLRELDGRGYVELRNNRGARVTQLSPDTLRDFFLSAPLIYEAILRLAARNSTLDQIRMLEQSQDAFRNSLNTKNAVERTLSNVRFHEITGDMAANIYLLPSFRRLLIDHARVGMIFYDPRSVELASKLRAASEQHDEIIQAIRNRDEESAAELAHRHWALSRNEIRRFVVPDGLNGRIGKEELDFVAQDSQ